MWALPKHRRRRGSDVCALCVQIAPNAPKFPRIAHSCAQKTQLLSYCGLALGAGGRAFSPPRTAAERDLAPQEISRADGPPIEQPGRSTSIVSRIRFLTSSGGCSSCTTRLQSGRGLKTFQHQRWRTALPPTRRPSSLCSIQRGIWGRPGPFHSVVARMAARVKDSRNFRNSSLLTTSLSKIEPHRQLNQTLVAGGGRRVRWRHGDVPKGIYHGSGVEIRHV